MDTRLKIRELVAGLSESQRDIMTEELRTAVAESRPRMSLDEITPARVSDPDFAAKVRAEIAAALRGEI
ncbi:MAG: hypothetical protein NTZ56_05445 [Acidobacteria bacterium]|nr:hypothetical protein [Acidobacteriota bacterium]